MAQDIRIDAIIRRNLAMRRLPLHYYSPMLVMAKRGLEEMHFDTLQKVKVAILTVDPVTFTAPLPEDFVDEAVVGFEAGDKVRAIGFDGQLNTQGGEFTPEADVYSYGNGFMFAGVMIENLYNEHLGFKGRMFGRPVTFTDSFTINREEGHIRIKGQSEITAIHLIYLSMPEKVTNKSVIHPYAQAALMSWVNWQWAIYNNGKDQELRRRDYYNDYRILRGRMNKMTTVEIKRIVRKNLRLSIKN